MNHIKKRKIENLIIFIIAVLLGLTISAVFVCRNIGVNSCSDLFIWNNLKLWLVWSIFALMLTLPVTVFIKSLIEKED